MVHCQIRDVHGEKDQVVPEFMGEDHKLRDGESSQRPFEETPVRDEGTPPRGANGAGVVALRDGGVEAFVIGSVPLLCVLDRPQESPRDGSPMSTFAPSAGSDRMA